MGEAIKLLVVDDETKFLDAIARRLEMRGLDVTTASNGAAALEAARRSHFDLALLDLKMPGMKGEEVLATLKAEHKFLEVIILTGHGSLDSAVTCTKLGAFGYLPKPYEFDQLISVLKDAYEQRLKHKYEHDQDRLEKLAAIALGESPLGVLRRMHELDEDQK